MGQASESNIEARTFKWSRSANHYTATFSNVELFEL